MRRGQCLSPLTAPSLWSEDDVVPVQGIAFGGSRSGGGEPPYVFKFFQHFSRAEIFIFLNIAVKPSTKNSPRYDHFSGPCQGFRNKRLILKAVLLLDRCVPCRFP
jgi:hypothetical protein